MTKEEAIQKIVDKHFNTLEDKVDKLSKSTQLTGKDIFDIIHSKIIMTYENVKPIVDDISKKYGIKLNIVGGIKRKGYSEHDIDVETKIEISKDVALQIMNDLKTITKHEIDVFVPSGNSYLRYGTTNYGGWLIVKMSKARRMIADKYADEIDVLKNKPNVTCGELEKLQMKRFNAMEAIDDTLEEMLDYYIPYKKEDWY